jgi:hypothetical protein
MPAYINFTKTYNVKPTNHKKIISFSIYGIDKSLDKEKGFYKGIFVNYELAKQVYPGWIIRVYMPDNEPADLIKKLIEMKEIELFLVDTNVCLRALRYLPNDDPSVDIWISRDLDSTVTFREKAAVDDWIVNYPDKELHIMADHAQHRWIIAGGMFGKKNNNDHSLRDFMTCFQAENPNEYEIDCVIAEKFFYREDNYVQHFGNGCKLQNSVPFPKHCMTNCTFVGAVVNMNHRYIELNLQNKYTLPVEPQKPVIPKTHTKHTITMASLMRRK